MKNHAYELGDLVKRGSAMGVVTDIDGMFMTLRLFENGSNHEHITANVSRRDYLRIVKTQTGIVYRNLTLDQRLLEHQKNGSLEAFLSEDTKNKTAKQRQAQ